MLCLFAGAQRLTGGAALRAAFGGVALRAAFSGAALRTAIPFECFGGLGPDMAGMGPRIFILSVLVAWAWI